GGDLGQFEFRSVVGVATEYGPRGVVFLDSERAYVDSWMSHTVAEVPYRRTRDVLKSFIVGSRFDERGIGGIQADIGIEVVSSSLPAELEGGRRMFFRATDNRMAAHSGGISCSTCHLDGRNDGITWTFREGDGVVRLQTPSLVGDVSATAPVTWTNSVPTVSAEVRITSSGRMGGAGVSILESEDVAAFIDSTPYPPQVVASDDAAALRGKAIFEGSAECSTCHTGELYTDSKMHKMFDLEAVRTPTLLGVAATAPYGHDGSAASLDALVAMAESRQMGKTNHLNEQDRADLVAFLKSL
ncbi:MAG: mono/diheme cytochrome c family protein, partial [Kiritimatiellia bacterium]